VFKTIIEWELSIASILWPAGRIWLEAPLQIVVIVGPA